MSFGVARPYECEREISTLELQRHTTVDRLRRVAEEALR